MTTVKIRFDPNTITCEQECWPAFKAGGTVLKVWALYQRRFLTNQYFRQSIVELVKYFEAAFDSTREDVIPYRNIDEFVEMMSNCGFHAGGYKVELAKWAAEYWDYFNLNIQKSLYLEYEVLEPVTKQICVSSNKPGATN